MNFEIIQSNNNNLKEFNYDPTNNYLIISEKKIEAKKPEKEIKQLIIWLGFEWDDKYLSPHLNKRAVYTTSKIQVRNPINNKSVALWKKYSELLKPVLEYFEEVNFQY